MADLFQTSPQNITIHLKNIYDEGELSEEATCKDYLQVQKEGNRTIGNFAQYHIHLKAIVKRKKINLKRHATLLRIS